MKKYALAAMVALLLTPAAFADEDEPAVYDSAHYRVRSYVGDVHAEETAERMEALFDLFSDTTRFELEWLEAPLRVTVFENREAFEEHLDELLGVVPDDFVYLHYRDPARNELIAYDRDEPEYSRGLNHQGFVQFIRAFVADPPTWLQEGLAVYFERSEYDRENREFTLVENLDWLPTARELYEEEEEIPLAELVQMGPEDAEAELERFYPQAWALVSFLLETEEREYARLIWDAFSALAPAAPRAENIEAVERTAFQWVALDELEIRLVDYLGGRRTPVDLVEEAVELYGQGELEEAEERFLQAIELDPENYVAYYYLGLINYDGANYGLAEYYYMRAAEFGAEEAVVKFALGVNAFAAGQYGSAEQYLETVLELDEERYAERVEELLERISP